MVKVIELPEGLREVCSREVWIPESNPGVKKEKPQPPEEDKPEPQKKLDLGTPF